MVAAPLGASVTERWLEVQEVLSAPEARTLEEPIDELLQAGAEIDVRRMTPQAAALVSWSQADPNRDDSVLINATEVDPELPASYFLLSRSAWKRGSYLTSVVRYLEGWGALFSFEVTRRHVLISLGIWAVMGVALACVVALTVMMLRTVRRLIHDAMVVGRMVFEGSNALVFGLVLLLLPIFAGLGPAWLLVYLSVAGWIYLERNQRVVAGVCCGVLALVPVLLDGWQLALLRTPPITDRVAVMLDERQLDPSSLREFLDLKSDFEGDSLYHLILGELLRMNSEIEAAKLEFQTATLEPFGDARPFVVLGNMAMEDGNGPLAIQYYDEAIATDGQAALAYHNLSSAYDLARKFQQGDSARNIARDLAGGRSAALGLRGRDPRIRYPLITSRDVKDLLAGLSHERLVQMGFSAPTWRPLRQFLSPMSVLFWVGGLLGLAVLLVRLKWFPAAKECVKCGKVYRLEAEPGESTVYCRQCVSVFLQRDLVPIDQQTAKLAQVRRWDRWTAFLRRVVAVIAPGSYRLVTDSFFFGALVGCVAWLLLVGIVVWVPRFLSVIEPSLQVLPITILLGVLLAVVWMRSAILSWQRR
jgi:tetratricopeptide (TPR) repeat protein